MDDKTLGELREYYIVLVVGAHRRIDLDSLVICLDWLGPILDEMCNRSDTIGRNLSGIRDKANENWGAVPISPMMPGDHLQIQALERKQVTALREYYFVMMITAHRNQEANFAIACLDWLSALVAEMRIRGKPLGLDAPSMEKLCEGSGQSLDAPLVN
jgi:hypothetical protein